MRIKGVCRCGIGCPTLLRVLAAAFGWCRGPRGFPASLALFEDEARVWADGAVLEVLTGPHAWGNSSVHTEKL